MIQDYLITNGSDIFIYPIYNEIYTYFYKNEINVPSNSIIRDLKTKYKEIKGIPIDEQKLFIGQKELYDNESISFYYANIHNIEYYHPPKGSKYIFVIFDTNICKLNGIIFFKDIISVSTIREKFCELSGLSYLNNTPLSYNGKELDENKTLKDYNISHESKSKLQ